MEINRSPEESREAETEYSDLIINNPNFRYLWSGHIVSLLGDWFNLIASATLIAKLSGSGTAIGGLFIVRMLAPFITSPLGGVVTDRFNRKYVLITVDIIRAVVVLGFLMVRDPGDIWLLYTLTFLQLGMSGFFFPARNSILPDLVNPSELGAANALSSATWSVMLALGAALGGITAGIFGVYTAFKIDSVTFILSALLISRISYSPALRSEPFKKALKNSVYLYIDGLRYLRERIDIFFIALNKAAITLFSFGGFQVIQVRISEKIFVIGEGGSTGLGIMFAIAGLGTGIGPIVVRRFTGDRERMLKVAIIWGYLLITLGMFVIAPLFSFSSVLTGILIRAIGGGIIWVFSTQLLLQILPKNYRGRVFATEFAMFTLMSASGAAAVGAIMDMTVNLTTIMLWMSLLSLIPAVLWGMWVLIFNKRKTDA